MTNTKELKQQILEELSQAAFANIKGKAYVQIGSEIGSLEHYFDRIEAETREQTLKQVLSIMDEKKRPAMKFDDTQVVVDYYDLFNGLDLYAIREEKQ